MAAYFVDASALSKRYVVELGTGWVRSILDPLTNCEVFIARTTSVEIISAITRRERSGTISAAYASTARSEFRKDLSTEYVVIDLTEALAVRAMLLAEAHALRGYDAIQLATAIHANTIRVAQSLPVLTLISSDLELNAAALAEGLVVDDPNTHP